MEPTEIIDEIRKKIDTEARQMINEAYERTVSLLTEKKSAVEKVAKRLLDKEVLNRDDMVELLGERQWKDKTNFDDLAGIAAPEETN